MRGAPSLSLLLATLLGRHLAGANYEPPAKYLIISNAFNGTISYVKLPGREVVPLITGLGHPQGLAVDQKRQLLLVADSQLERVVSYGLSLDSDGALSVDEQTPLIERIESRSVSVDGSGNVFASDETGNRIVRLPAQKIIMGDTAGELLYAASGTRTLPAATSLAQARVTRTVAEEAYLALDGAPQILGGADEAQALGAEGNSLSPPVAGAALSAPGGVATDNFYVYWTNKVDGDQVGTVVRDLAVRPTNTTQAGPQRAEVLASNAPKAYGLCLALDNVFFTGFDSHVYAVKSTGGDVVTISSNFSSPRGCAWDGDSTVYIADRSANAIFAIPASQASLTQARPQKVVDFQDAFGVAVFSGARAPYLWATVSILILGLLIAQVDSTER
jgi:hypothetical protein